MEGHSLTTKFNRGYTALVAFFENGKRIINEIQRVTKTE